MRARDLIRLCACLIVSVMFFDLSASGNQAQALKLTTCVMHSGPLSAPPEYPPCSAVSEVRYVWGRKAITVCPLAIEQANLKVSSRNPRPPLRASCALPEIIIGIALILLAIIIIIRWVCKKKKSTSTQRSYSGRLRVMYAINNTAPVTEELSPEVRSEGITYTLNVKSWSIGPGDTFKLLSKVLLNEKGSPIEDTGKTAAPIELSVPEVLFTSATAEGRSANYRTWISTTLDVTTPSRTTCPGPFEFRIQKRQVTRYRSKGKTKVRVIWIDMPKRYTTNKQIGLWHVRTVNLVKGTYRSVVYGKCGLVGGVTRRVALRR